MVGAYELALGQTNEAVYSFSLAVACYDAPRHPVWRGLPEAILPLHMRLLIARDLVRRRLGRGVGCN